MKDEINELQTYISELEETIKFLKKELKETTEEKTWLKNLVERAYWDGFEDCSFLRNEKKASYNEWETSLTKRELDARYTNNG